MLKKILIGLSAGIISGLFSTGGGMILVPAFIYLLKLNEKEARATSIICILPMVIVTSYFYTKSNYINYTLGFQCAMGGIIGSFLGTKFMHKLKDKSLKIIFILFVLYIGIKFVM